MTAPHGTYRYEEDGVGELRPACTSCPATADGQTCRASTREIDPAPDDLRERTDYFGNRGGYFYAIHPSHTDA